MYERWYANLLSSRLKRPFVHLLFGARQTGKSTLLQALLPPKTFQVNLANPEERSRYAADSGLFIRECEGLPRKSDPSFVFVDEAQLVPSIFDAVQYLYDRNKTRWRFVLCGGSARKLRRTGANLLPGRSMLHYLYPLICVERPPPFKADADVPRPVPFEWGAPVGAKGHFPSADLMERLVYGELPGVVTLPSEERGLILKSYATVFLEEEVRREALVKDWGGFVRFLPLAAMESGQILNYAHVSQESGISQPTIKNYYQLLEDMFVGFQVLAFSKSPRKNLLSSPKYYLFDLGVRHALAGFHVTEDLVRANPGPIFEQWVGIELWKRLHYLGSGKLYHQRTKDGAEIDFIVERGEELIPIEVKWTERPQRSDARHLISFLKENPKRAKKGFVICRCLRPQQLEESVIALPWYEL